MQSKLTRLLNNDASCLTDATSLRHLDDTKEDELDSLIGCTTRTCPACPVNIVNARPSIESLED
ncbi:hypothetical protein [Vibrio phage vB_VhaP_PG11]|nr:hypothetical protein [Vibrio phage vB_VhaP_PG11]